MQKKLESELISIAHSILQMKNKDDAIALRDKTLQLYEKLSVLTFVDEYLDTTPHAKETKEELIEKVKQAIEVKHETKVEKEVIIEEEKEVVDEVKEVIVDEIVEEETIEEEAHEMVEEEILAEENRVEEEVKEIVEIAEVGKKQLTLEEEFKDAVSVDVTADLFRKAASINVQTETVTATKEVEAKTSLNDKLMQSNIQVGLNDRIAFVKHLFNHSQADFNRVLSQLNSLKTEKEAKNFISKMVKPDYDWSGKDEYEERLIALIERRFA